MINKIDNSTQLKLLLLILNVLNRILKFVLLISNHCKTKKFQSKDRFMTLVRNKFPALIIGFLYELHLNELL